MFILALIGSKERYKVNMSSTIQRKYLWFSISAALFGVAFIGTVDAQNIRQYWYEEIQLLLAVNKDSTVDAFEEQTFHFDGTYHKGYRSIPLNRVSRITNILVIDGKTGEQLQYSRRTLDKDDPASWGKYTEYVENGSQVIEWYFDASDGSYTWILQYKIHGALEFQTDWDRLYWDIFTDYDVPVKAVSVRVSLSEPVNNSEQVSYRTGRGEQVFGSPPGMQDFSFFETGFLPKDAYTIDIAWPKGLTDRSAFWWDFFAQYYGYISSAVITFLSILFIFFYWLFTEKLKKGKGVIIPQYEPPQNLRPAMAEVITKERVTPVGWAATVVDLAIRGYIRIEEVPQSLIFKVGKTILVLFVLCLIVGVLILKFSVVETEVWLSIFSGPFILVLIVLFFVFRGRLKTGIQGINQKDYILHLVQRPDAKFEDYEMSFIRALFPDGETFSTKDIRKKKLQSRRLLRSMYKVKDGLYEETSEDTNAYDIDLAQEKKKVVGLSIIAIGVVLCFAFIIDRNAQVPQIVFLFASILLSYFFISIFMRYEARLSRAGMILKEEWLGFKLYLETAEKHRMQNLSPELFEKYLPYAMIFGVEKKWARAFEGISVPQPAWYGGGVHSGSNTSLSAGAAGFSASAFSASFSSSFTSAFSSSGGGGSGGGAGGGGAGGGGGGGGGGAS